MRTPEQVVAFIEDAAFRSYTRGEGIDTTQMSRFEKIIDLTRDDMLKNVTMRALGEKLCMNNYMQDVIDTTPPYLKPEEIWKLGLWNKTTGITGA